MPCMVEEVEREEAGTPEERAEADELREIDEEILLIATNGQRERRTGTRCKRQPVYGNCWSGSGSSAGFRGKRGN